MIIICRHSSGITRTFEPNGTQEKPLLCLLLHFCWSTFLEEFFKIKIIVHKQNHKMFLSSSISQRIYLGHPIFPYNIKCMTFIYYVCMRVWCAKQFRKSCGKLLMAFSFLMKKRTVFLTLICSNFQHYNI